MSLFLTQMSSIFTLRSLIAKKKDGRKGFLEEMPSDEDKETWVSNKIVSQQGLRNVIIQGAYPSSFLLSVFDLFNPGGLGNVVSSKLYFFSTLCKLYSLRRRDQADYNCSGQSSCPGLGQVNIDDMQLLGLNFLSSGTLRWLQLLSTST